MRRVAWGFGLAAALAAAALPGCRDLVTPEEEPEEVSPFQLLLFGLEGVLDGATVTLDNSAYVSPGDAVRWTVLSDRGETVFPGWMSSTFDLSIAPRASSPTPRWERIGLAAPDTALVLEYPGVPVELELDPLMLAEYPEASSSFEVSLLYRLPHPEDPSYRYQTHVTIRRDEDGKFRGDAPWYGFYHAHVTAESNGLRFFYHSPDTDSLQVPDADAVQIPNPVRSGAVSFTVAGGATPWGSARVTHSEFRNTFAGVYLWSPVEYSSGPDSLPLLELGLSWLLISPLDGVQFMPKVVAVEGWNALPQQIDLGEHLMQLHAMDAFAQTLGAAAFTVRSDQSDLSISGGENGRMQFYGDAGTYRVEVTAPGHLERTVILTLSGNQGVDIVLDVQ